MAPRDMVEHGRANLLMKMGEYDKHFVTALQRPKLAALNIHLSPYVRAGVFNAWPAVHMWPAGRFKKNNYKRRPARCLHII
jgi:hypothetical protein